MAALDGAGIKVAGGCPNSVALFNAFAVNATYREDETCLLVHVGAEGLDLAIQRGGELLFARNATPGRPGLHRGARRRRVLDHRGQGRER